jgi:hypothetical protein
MKNYLPRQCFQNGFSYSERDAFARKYDGSEWDESRKHIQDTQRCLISKSAIRVAEVIKAKLDINLFPLIIPIACKGFDIGGGTFAFMMYDDEGDCWCFDCRASMYKSMKGEYYIQNINGQSVIGRNA